MRIIIAGSRRFNGYEILKRNCIEIISRLQYYLEIPSSELEIISGHARGTDIMGERFAEEFDLLLKTFPADWKDMSEPCIVGTNEYGQYNKLAGSNRNKQMALYAGQDGKLIAFVTKKSNGILDMIRHARNNNLEVFEIDVSEFVVEEEKKRKKAVQKTMKGL